jgi:hypothetical protein
MQVALPDWAAAGVMIVVTSGTASAAATPSRFRTSRRERPVGGRGASVSKCAFPSCSTASQTTV